MACRVGTTGHLCEMARPGHYASTDGAGDSLPRLRGAAPRLLDLRRGAADRRRPALGLAPRGGMGRRRPEAVLRRARAHPSRRALRPDRLRALVARARPAADRRVRKPAARGGDRCRRRERDRVRVVVLLPRGLAARRAPTRARPTKIVYFGGYATRDDIPEATQASLDRSSSASNWRLAAQMLAGLFDPHAAGDAIAQHTQMQRAAASAEAASIFLELDLSADLRDLLPRVAVPALVLHRRGDRTVPIGRGRELASLLPNARFVPLTGDSHLPWRDDQRELFRALAGFLYSDAAPGAATARRRSRRERRRCCASSPPACRTARSPRRSCSASTRCTATSRTSCASCRSRPGRARRRTPRGSVSSDRRCDGGGRRRRRAVALRLSHAGL